MVKHNNKPNELYDYVFSDKGPEIPLNEVKALYQQRAKLGSTSKLAANTTTYVRCYYIQESSAYFPNGTNNLKSGYVWAKHADGKTYYKITGSWHSMLGFKNMFYTDTRLVEIRNMCQYTIDNDKDDSYLKKARPVHPLFEVAADQEWSYNHTIWQNDNPNDNSKVINKIISFGDSLSDTNNMYNASQWYLPSTDSWAQGRFANEKVWTEYLAQDLNLALGLNLPLYNWAIGGSAGDAKYFGIIPGLKDQAVSWLNYAKTAENYEPKRTLATILIGGNDFITYDRSATMLLADVETTIQTLYNKGNGIKHILLLNLPDLTQAPVFRVPGATTKDRKMVLKEVNEFNNSLPALVSKLHAANPGLDVHIFDTRAALDEIIANKAMHGFDNITDACLDVGKGGSMTYVDNVPRTSICTNPDKYLFWDLMHISTKGHRTLEILLMQDEWLKKLFTK